MKTIPIFYLSLALICCFGLSSFQCPESRIIHNTLIAPQKGVSFIASYKPTFKINDLKSRYTADSIDIILGETLLKKFNHTQKRKLVKFNRQYLGYYDTNGNKHLLIQFINTKIKKTEKPLINGWECEFIVGFGKFYENNTVLFNVNLSKKSVSWF